MGQYEILNFLEKNKGKFFSSKEIAKGIGLSSQSVYSRIKKLRDQKNIFFKEIFRKNNCNYKQMIYSFPVN